MTSKLRLFTVGKIDAQRVLGFYESNPDPHLMPRDLSQLQKMAEEKELYALEDEVKAIMGVAYVHVEPTADVDEPDMQAPPEREREFGGIYFHKDLRGSGVPDDFCAVVLGTVIAMTSDQYVEIVAHTHVANGRPHKLLGKLGFAPTDTNDSFPASQFPTMRESIDKKIWGVRHRYLRKYLAKSLAVSIRRFSGMLGSGSNALPTEIAFEDWDKDEIADALERLSCA